MNIAVNAIPAVNGNATEVAFGAGVLSRLPPLMPETSFFYAHDYDTPLLEHPNVKSISFGEAVENSIYFSIGRLHYLNSGFAPVVMAIVEADHIAYPERVWWKLGRPAADPMVVDVAEAEFILVPHQNLRQAITDAYPQSAAKIKVVGHGLPESPLTPADPVTRRITKEVYGREHSYFFAPARGHPSDNLERLFGAYDLFRARCPEPVRLLVENSGKPPRSVRKAQKQSKHSADIVFLPRLSQHEHRNVFSSARAILYPSLSTSFPLPVLDAWTAEVPVLYINNDILQGGGALVRGEEVKSIAEGMVALVTTPFLASGLVENGKQRLTRFSWDRVAERVAEVLRGMAGGAS